MTNERVYSTTSLKYIKVSDITLNKNEINSSSQFKAVLPPTKYVEENENETIEGFDTEKVSSSSSFSDLPGTVHADHKLAVIYTCKVCSTRSGKMIGKQAYDHGVVIVRCPGCDNLHLIADRLQFFEDESWDIEKGLAKYGEKVTAVNEDNILELTPKEIMGEKR